MDRDHGLGGSFAYLYTRNAKRSDPTRPFEVSVDQSGTNPIYLLADVRPMTQAERVELKRKGRVIRPQVYIGHLDPRSISPIDALAPISPGQAWGAGRNKP
jgi:hypothetical protein